MEENILIDEITEGVRVVKNSALVMLFQVVGRIFGILTTALIARSLSKANFGIFSLFLTIIGFMALASTLGLDQLTVREVARFRDAGDKVLAAAVATKLVISALLIVASVFVGFLADWSPEKLATFLILATTILFGGLINSLSSYLYGFEKLAHGSIITASQSFFILGFSLFALHFWIGQLVPFSTAYAAGVATSSIIAMLWVMPKLLEGFKQLDRQFVFSLIKQALPFLGLAFSLFAYYKVNILVLAKLKGPEAVGIYSASFRVIESLLFLPAALTGALFPTASRLAATSSGLLEKTHTQILRILAIIGIPGTTVLFLLSDKIIILLYGAKWQASVLPLRVMAWAWGLIFLNCTVPVILNAANKAKITLKVVIAGVSSNVILCLFLIPRYGVLGASIATVATEVLNTFLFFQMIKKHVYRIRFFSFFGRIFFASLLMGCGLIIARQWIANIWSLVIIAMSAYSVLLLLVKALRPEDGELLREALIAVLGRSRMRA